MPDHKLDEEIKISPADSNDSIKIVAEKAPSNSEEKPDEKTIVLQNFELNEEIGSGTLGRVFRATNVNTGSKFAAKEISYEYSRNSCEIKAVLSSLKAATEIANPHLCAYYSCGMHDEQIYTLSDELTGQTLADAINSGRVFNTDRFIELIRQVCDALKSLHQRNIIHGNLKPSNIFLIDTGTGHDFVKITDFGIAGAFGEEQRHEFLRRSGGSYLSPEQCLGYELDQRSDIYSVGLIMYEMVTGKPFIEGDTPVHSVLKQLNTNCKKGLKESGVPDSIQQIIRKCLEKNRAQRYFSIADLDMDLDLATAAQTDLSAFAAQWSDESKKKKPLSEQKVKFVLSVIICAGLLGCLVLAAVNQMNSSMNQPYTVSSTTLPYPGAMSPPQPNFPPSNMFLDRSKFNSEDAAEEAERAVAQAMSSIAKPTVVSPVGDAFDSTTSSPLDANVEAQLNNAESWYRQAINAYQKENNGRTDSEYKTKLAGLYTSLGEIYSRATFSLDGAGKYDRKYEIMPSLGINNGNGYGLYPAYPGLYPNTNNPGAYDKSAESALDKAAQLLGDKFTAKDINLLWDLTYIKFQMGKIDESINFQQKIIDVLKAQNAPDLSKIILSYDNLGRMHLWKSQIKLAVEDFKTAKSLDKATYHVPGTSEYADLVRADLAYGYYMDGRLPEAERMARKNISALEGKQDAGTDSERLNMYVLYNSLKLQHKHTEALEIENLAYKKNIAPW